MKTCNEIAPLLSAYFDGELTECERSEVLAHLDECAACRARLAEYAAMQTELLAVFEEEDAPAGFAEGVMTAIRAEKSAAPKKTKKNTWRRFMPVAACVALVLLAVSLFPQMSKMDNTAAADTAAPMSADDATAMPDMDNGSAPDEAYGDREAANDTELADGYYSLSHGSAYYETPEDRAADGGDATMTKSLENDNGLVYFCEPTTIAKVGEDGEEGLLWAHQHGPVVFDLYGAEATEYVEENGGVKADDAGYWYLPIAALLALPDDITIRDVQAAALAEVPEEAEWVIVCPDGYNYNEVP